MTSLEAVAERAARSAFAYRFHRRHRSEAARLLATIEADRGPLPGAVAQQCDDWAGDVLGWRGYAPWLRVYAAVAGRFREGWIPDNYYGRVVLPAVQGPYGEVSKLKPLSRRLLQSDLIADVAYWVNGGLYGRDLQHLDRADLAAALFDGADRAVFKSDDSIQGAGVRVLHRSTFDPAALATLPSGVFQSWVEQHPVLAAVTPDSVATVRVTTAVTDDGNASVRAAYLRFGRAADTHVRSDSHVRVAVGTTDGRLAAEGFTPRWTTVAAHPDSGAGFAGLTVPGFAACTGAVLELHRRMPFARCVGWDLTVDAGGHPVVLEWNAGHNDIKFSEATQGPCFADMGWERLWRRGRTIPAQRGPGD
ncbi:sugar-transfer associated ATP-grasp domain-containing protein [Pseudonocardia spirodelae]|uniref:Sugar-transfer associated ATP-grasp domain-containing protein n=1 Tax=Pseudonocardia spirodelae TaxID=3133431 RepID=A0ABU8TA02_9PSEU